MKRDDLKSHPFFVSLLLTFDWYDDEKDRFMKAFKNGCPVDIWKIPTKREISRYATIHIPPDWINTAFKKGWLLASLDPLKMWDVVDVVTENGYKRALPGEWICRFGDNDFWVYTSKEIESQFRTPFGDDF